MAKDKPETKPKEPTPFEKFDRLAKKIVRVPKRETEKTVSRSKRTHAT